MFFMGRMTHKDQGQGRKDQGLNVTDKEFQKHDDQQHPLNEGNEGEQLLKEEEQHGNHDQQYLASKDVAKQTEGKREQFGQ